VICLDVSVTREINFCINQMRGAHLQCVYNSIVAPHNSIHQGRYEGPPIKDTQIVGIDAAGLDPIPQTLQHLSYLQRAGHHQI
jgi:hypothetical protein